MSVQERAGVVALKESVAGHRNGEYFLDFTLGDALPSRLAALSLRLPVDSMATPPALAAPPAPAAPKTLATPPAFSVRVAEEEDAPRLLEFLQRTFFVDEPLNVAVGLLEGGRCRELESYSVSSLPQRLSFLAESGGRLLGVLLGGAEQREDHEAACLLEPGAGCAHERFRSILRFLGECERRATVFRHFPDLQSCYDLKIIAVDPACRGQGVASCLTRTAFAAAKDAGLGFLKISCSSHFSAKIAERMGCEEVFRLPYAEYTHAGRTVFHPPAPHEHFVLKAMRL